jgi:hypothetical protein
MVPAMSTRELSPPPVAVLDPYGWPRFGSYRGELPRVRLGSLDRGPLFRLTHHKRWMYVVIASGDLLVVAAVVHIGYLSNAFVYALDAKERRMLAHHAVVGPAFAAKVGDAAGEGSASSFKLGGASVRINRPLGSSDYSIEAKIKDIDVVATLRSAGAPPPIAAIVPVPDGLIDMTEKRALLDVTGEAVVAGRRLSLDGGLAGFDYTNGLMPRRTTWRWAFALGRAKSGERVGLNLVQGFTGQAECALWVDGEIYPLGEGSFAFDAENMLSPWQIRTADGGVDLRFEPMAMHSDERDYVLLKSKFFQPSGAFSGRIRVPGEKRADLELEGVLGVAEDQDMLW